MIDKQPAPGEMTKLLMAPYTGGGGGAVMLHEPVPARRSQVLGPDGNSVMISVPRRQMGFNLTPKTDT
jgi:hypothetical protein